MEIRKTHRHRFLKGRASLRFCFIAVLFFCGISSMVFADEMHRTSLNEFEVKKKTELEKARLWDQPVFLWVENYQNMQDASVWGQLKGIVGSWRCYKKGELSELILHKKKEYYLSLSDKNKKSHVQVIQNQCSRDGGQNNYSDFKISVTGQPGYNIHIKAAGDAYVFENFLYIVEYGCCGSAGYMSRYDLATGKALDRKIMIEPWM